MKVLYYCMSLTRSGGGLYTAMSGLAQAVKTQGIDLTVAGGIDEHFAEDRSAWDGINLVSHPFNGGYRLDRNMFETVNCVRPDIMHIHGIWHAGSVYARYAQIRGVKIVTSPHGMLDPWILSRSRALKSVHGTLFERPLIRRGWVHALNEAERQATQSYEPLAETRTFVLPNGVNVVTAPSPNAQRNGAVYLGRLHEKKQVIELAEAWAKIPNNKQILTIAGWGAQEYEQSLKDRIRPLQRVKFVGPVFGDAKTALLQGARYFILPSLSEGLPMAVLEAAQSGAVPIITDGCNLPELIQNDGAIGIADDFSDFNAVLQAALSMPNEQFALKSHQAMWLSQKYAWPSIAQQMATQYTRILES